MTLSSSALQLLSSVNTQQLLLHVSVTGGYKHLAVTNVKEIEEKALYQVYKIKKTKVLRNSNK